MPVAGWWLWSLATQPRLSTLPPPPLSVRPRLPQLATHGPGLFLSRHIHDQPDDEDQALHFRGRNKRRGGRAGGGGGGGRRKGEDETPVLGDLDWGLSEEPSLLLWDGERIGRERVLQPSPETRPIRLVVSGDEPNVTTVVGC